MISLFAALLGGAYALPMSPIGGRLTVDRNKASDLTPAIACGALSPTGAFVTLLDVRQARA
jgi:hypothetical protein